MAENLIRHELLVANPEGLHARPAASLVKLASQFDSRIELLKDEMRVNAKSIMDLLTLAAEQGTVLVLEVQGDDAHAAATAIAKAFLDGFRDSENEDTEIEPDTPERCTPNRPSGKEQSH